MHGRCQRQTARGSVRKDPYTDSQSSDICHGRDYEKKGSVEVSVGCNAPLIQFAVGCSDQ